MNEKTLLDPTTSSAFEPTMRENQGHSLPQTEDVSAKPSGHQSLIRLPEMLEERYTIIKEMPAEGGEADLVLARTESGKNVVVKLYRPGIVPKPEILEYVHGADPDFIIQQLEYGEAGGRWYEIMEFAAHGSLRDLLNKEGPRLDSELVRAILKELAAALNYLHGQTPRIVHRDLKPGNILLRSRNPLDIVFADFGISSMLEQSVRFTSANRSVRYAAPEAMAGAVSPASDWWAIGIMTVEMLSGRHPFAHLEERVVTNALYERRPIDLLGVAETDWQMLCKGLLHFDAKTRWGAKEVERWLAGDRTLTLPSEPAASPRQQEARATRPYRIAGADVWALDEFLHALARNWDEAVKRMARRTDIERWLLNDLQDQDAYNTFLDIVSVQDVDPQTQLTSLLMALMPGAVPEEVDVATVAPGVLQAYLQAAAGVVDAQLRLGQMLLKGEVLSVDAAQAKFWLDKAAAQGNAAAQEACQDFVLFQETLAKAESGDLQSWLDVGKMYADGKGTATDHVKAVACYRKAAEEGIAIAQSHLGRNYYYGQGVPQDYVQSVEWFRKAADQGEAEAQHGLGCCYSNGDSVPQDDEQAAGWYRMAADQGNAKAQNNLGLCYAYGQGVPQDFAQAAVWYHKAAESGHADAQNNLGVCYEHGQGVPQDSAQAVEWYRKAADQGHADAQNNLGECYKNGQAVPQDHAQAVEWFRKAADQGHADAQTNLGVSYENGQGVPQDYGQAVEWYRKAAEQGNAWAQNNLGVCYVRGQGVPQDYGQAVEWYRKAAEQGEVWAQTNLGWCYRNGQGVPQDYEQAVQWYKMAAAQGNNEAEEGHKEAAEQLVKAYTRLADANNAEAQYKLGMLLFQGEYVPRNEFKAIKWLNYAAENGNMLAQRELGICFAKGLGMPKSKRSARYWYKKAIAQGDSESQRLIEEVKGWF